MSSPLRDGNVYVIATLFISLVMLLSGCGTPGAPQPPSLNLPDRVSDLSAARAGNQVTLTWTMPRRNTDKIPLKGNIDVEICRQQGRNFSATLCEPAGRAQFAPASDGTFSETLPPAVSSGPPRELIYRIELRNSRGRSAGFSNEAVVVAGQAPSPVTGFAAEVRKQGIVLHWSEAEPGASIRLRRKLLTPPPPKPKADLQSAPPEPVEQNLLVNSAPGVSPSQAIDKAIAFGNTYEYRAQRLIHADFDGHTLELQGALSAPIRVEALDIFPPSVPIGLAAVATAPDPASNSPASIDLSWQPGSDSDLAGYAVYRREEQSPWQRISGSQPVVGPAFHDAHVLPGHTYQYAITAIDKDRHESGRSAPASESVPVE